MTTNTDFKARKLEALNSDLARSERILAAGGFRDKDGDWIACNVDRMNAEIAKLKAMIAKTEAQ